MILLVCDVLSAERRRTVTMPLFEVSRPVWVTGLLFSARDLPSRRSGVLSGDKERRETLSGDGEALAGRLKTGSERRRGSMTDPSEMVHAADTRLP
jgi:hypothetical protein